MGMIVERLSMWAQLPEYATKNASNNTLFFVLCPLPQHLYPFSVWMLQLGACLFKAPVPKSPDCALIGQLSQVWADTAHRVSASALSVRL